jgi:hypothetical protein
MVRRSRHYAIDPEGTHTIFGGAVDEMPDGGWRPMVCETPADFDERVMGWK